MADKNLTVKIGGDNKKLKRTFSDSRRELSRFGGFVKNFGAKFGLIGGALAGGGAIVGGGFAIKIFADKAKEVDEITKLGKQFGFTTEQIQIFKRVAGLTGTSLNQLLKGFGQLSKSVVQFVRDGTGPGMKVFEDLGLGAAELEKAFSDPVALLELLGGALNKIENPLKRSALLEELLGARNKQLAVALADASTIFANVAKDFERLGLGLTKEETESVEAFRDVLLEISDTIENKILKSVAQIAKELQPAVDLAKEFTEALVGDDAKPGALVAAGSDLAIAGGQALSGRTRGPSLGGALLGGNPIAGAFKVAGLGLETIGAAGKGEFSVDNVRAFFARGLRGALETVGVPQDSQFAQSFIELVRGSVGAVPGRGVGTINGRRIADINRSMPSGTMSIPFSEQGAGSINGRPIADILAESKKQTGELGILNRRMGNFIQNTRTGNRTAVAAP